MNRTLLLVTFLALTFGATEASAWDFTCSPARTAVIGYKAPSVMLMLDRSGSMADADGRVPRTCKACVVAQEQLEVASASECTGSGLPWSFNESWTIEQDGAPSSGYAFEKLFFVPPARDSLEIEVVADADLNGRCEFADVYVDGDLLYTIRDGGNCSPTTHSFAVDPAYASDGQVEVRIVTAPDGNTCGGRSSSCVDDASCDGVDTFCTGGSHFDVTVANVEPSYLGTVTQEDPCGAMDKWEQALGAIDAVTTEAQAATPERVHFGLGLFNGNSAEVSHECAPSNNAPIMTSLEATSPTGSTPTARAIRVAHESECVTGEAFHTITSETWVPRDDQVSGFDMDVVLEGIEHRDVELVVTTFGDFAAECEFADVVVDGFPFGRISDSEDCRSEGFARRFDIPALLVEDGRLRVTLQTRADGEPSEYPTCADEDGVDARCATNGFIATVRWLDDDRPPTATILINDGEPTRDLDNSSAEPYRDAVAEACVHRISAPVFIVGLGAGTDVEFNDILAAAGGSGSCVAESGAPADPCDDPDDWATLRGRCTGSIQVSDRDGLLTELAAITAELGCSFDISFTNSGYDQVPTDPAGGYEYVAVDVRMTDDSTDRLFFSESPWAQPAGEGWEFATVQRQSVRLTDSYCEALQNFSYLEVTTQLACLCQQEEGTACEVPDHVALGVCPRGTWTCLEGTDWCEPDPVCCVADELCQVPDLHGVCAEGVMVCDTLQGTCVQVNTPSPEVCDGVDNDCDGVVDDVPSSCVVEGEVGRCAVGTRTCDGGEDECESVFGPMPELCNGLDDDCDGVVDNLSTSWAKPQFAPYHSQDAMAPSCRQDDVCRCPSGATDDHAGPTFSSYVDEWDPVCQCGSSLAPPLPSSRPTAERLSRAGGCETTETGSQASTWVLLLVVALLRRRFSAVAHE